MIPVKQKKCAGCSEYKHIWKSHGKEKYCKECWYKMEPPKKAAPISKKRKVEQDEYSKRRELFLIAHPKCEAKLVGCTGNATDVHHLFSGKDRDKYYLKISTWKAVCRSCHNYIHDHLSADDAIEMGLRLKE